MASKGLIGALATMLAGAALAGEPGKVAVELNKLEAAAGGCRPYLVIENGTEHVFSSLKLDLVMFDTDGIIVERVAVDAAPLPTGKTAVKIFDLKGLACDRIGRMLLNGLTGCSAGDAAPEDCLSLISTRSQATVPFIQ
ncbi:MAG: Tat pathway signal sequence domain protein [Alphaproteobacteria bacterium]